MGGEYRTDVELPSLETPNIEASPSRPSATVGMEPAPGKIQTKPESPIAPENWIDQILGGMESNFSATENGGAEATNVTNETVEDLAAFLREGPQDLADTDQKFNGGNAALEDTHASTQTLEDKEIVPQTLENSVVQLDGLAALEAETIVEDGLTVVTTEDVCLSAVDSVASSIKSSEPQPGEGLFKVDTRPALGNVSADYGEERGNKDEWNWISDDEKLGEKDIKEQPRERLPTGLGVGEMEEISEDEEQEENIDQPSTILSKTVETTIKPVPESERSVATDVSSISTKIETASDTALEIKSEKIELVEKLESVIEPALEVKEESKYEGDADEGEGSDFEFSDEDTSSDEEVEPTLSLQERERRLVAMDENGGDDDDQPSATRLRTKNELAALPKIEPITEPIPQDASLRSIGTIHSTVDDLLVIQSPPTDNTDRVLDADTIVLFSDRTPLGRIFETFGPVTKPLYSIRFNSVEEVQAMLEKSGTGTEVFVAEGLEKVVFTRVLKAYKGSDASNIHDEEVGEEEMEFSDDEQEAEFKRQLKLKRKRAANTQVDGNTGSPGPADQALMDNAEYQILQRPRGQQQARGRSPQMSNYNNRYPNSGGSHSHTSLNDGFRRGRGSHDGGFRGHHQRGGRGGRGRGGYQQSRGGYAQSHPFQQQGYPQQYPSQAFPPYPPNPIPNQQQQQLALAALSLLNANNPAMQNMGMMGGFDISSMMGMMQGVLQQQQQQQGSGTGQNQGQSQEQQQTQPGGYGYDPRLNGGGL
ncbi:uncharacterized protein SPPG_00573 [Spizellomyces punctatus DAOM BR117]|uniref:H/ACA ribonucleoprotein complex non-core subunit NAF1 n=1 Tax=Spizellomyces punctatus (strain DAOM BR117) TaxID=645134 RepID=A0A0L0HVE3_SPIPD|nr:uncharacterized protein SPPG_00573 [Spizellomyces punctatus DAOM BR117]KND04875.1 hypothetical protein SPPG_00573 [Spizellomyces punctatus DAOM BR117]|eukprot:XP_016612914.1 hypothetical protein SPPG_00573 [Spizellomyces punctatus DAOM BR117]